MVAVHLVGKQMGVSHIVGEQMGVVHIVEEQNGAGTFSWGTKWG